MNYWCLTGSTVLRAGCTLLYGKPIPPTPPSPRGKWPAGLIPFKCVSGTSVAALTTVGSARRGSSTCSTCAERGHFLWPWKASAEVIHYINNLAISTCPEKVADPGIRINQHGMTSFRTSSTANSAQVTSETSTEICTLVWCILSRKSSIHNFCGVNRTRRCRQ